MSSEIKSPNFRTSTPTSQMSLKVKNGSLIIKVKIMVTIIIIDTENSDKLKFSSKILFKQMHNK